MPSNKELMRVFSKFLFEFCTSFRTRNYQLLNFRFFLFEFVDFLLHFVVFLFLQSHLDSEVLVDSFESGFEVGQEILVGVIRLVAQLRQQAATLGDLFVHDFDLRLLVFDFRVDTLNVGNGVGDREGFGGQCQFVGHFEFSHIGCVVLFDRGGFHLFEFKSEGLE